jgi:hypothetical protein
VRKTELTQLEAVPVLFHSGYLTVDKVISALSDDPESKNSKGLKSYTFKLPNFEISSSYYLDCFRTVFDKITTTELEAIREKLLSAILARDADTLSSLFINLFSSVTYHQKPEGEKIFHAYVQLIFLAADFQTLSELPSPKGRLDLCVELPDKVFAVIELKFCKKLKKRAPNEENAILASLAVEQFSQDQIFQFLAKKALNELDNIEIYKILSEFNLKKITETEKNALIGLTVLKTLPKDRTNLVLADAVRETLPLEVIEKALISITPKIELTPMEIDNVLLKSANKALSDISKKDYHGPLRLKAKEIIDIGLAIYDYGANVKAVFSPDASDM